MRQSEVEDAILKLVAEQEGRQIQDLRRELLERGLEMPIDSLQLVEILVALEQRFDVRLPESQVTARSLQSVKALAALVCRMSAEQGTDQVVGA